MTQDELTQDEERYASPTADVLLVDFSDGVRCTMAEILRTFGFSVLDADTADAALEVLNRHRVGVIVLEPDLPGRNGLETIEAFAALDDPPPVLVLSARPVEAGQRERMKHLVTGYLQKPVSPEALMETLRATLEGRETGERRHSRSM